MKQKLTVIGIVEQEYSASLIPTPAIGHNSEPLLNREENFYE
jgi:hypothetical protein